MKSIKTYMNPTSTLQLDQQSQNQEYNRLLSEFSRGINEPYSHNTAVKLRSSLRMIARFLGVDTIDLVIFTELEQHERILGQWYDAKLFDQLACECPWVISEAARGKLTCIHDHKQLPGNADRDRETFAQYGIQSLYGIPLFGNTEISGALLLGVKQLRTPLDSEAVDRAQILGQILVNNIKQAQNTEHLNDAVEAAEIGLWSLDYSTMSFWATETARFMHGLDPDQRITLNDVLALVHADDRALIQNTIEQALIRPQNIQLEYRVLQADGTLAWIIARGRSYRSAPGVQQLTGVCVDITERKQVDEELQNSQALTKAVFDSVPGLLYLYSEDGQLLRWNKQHEKMTGYSVDELQNFSVSDWFTEQDHALMVQEWSKVFSEGYTKTELGLKLKNGSIVPFSLTGVKVEIDGKPHLVGIGMDITERRQAEASLAQLRAELTHITRITTLGEHTSALAHELNQPLTAILSNAQAARRLMAKQPPDLEEVRDALEDIVRDDKRAGEIVHGLRRLMSKSKGAAELLDINTLVLSVSDLTHGELVLSDIPLRLDLAPELPMIMAGQTEVQQVFLNLILNAIEAQRLTDPRLRDMRIKTWRDTNTNHVIVAIRDCGEGIHEDQLQQIFEPFFSTKNSGMGMGLAICRRIAESYQGQLWAENNPDCGATFYLSFPIAEKRK